MFVPEGEEAIWYGQQGLRPKIDGSRLAPRTQGEAKRNEGRY